MKAARARAALALTVVLMIVVTVSGVVTGADSEGAAADIRRPRSEVQAAIDFRESFGLRADPDYVAWSLADPAAFPNSDWGVPLSAEETADMRARLEVQERMGRVIPSGAKGYAGAYIDQRRGGIPVYLFTEVPEVPEDVRAYIARHMSGIEYEIHEVEFTLEELTTLKESISAAREDLAAEGIELVSVSVHVTENRVEVGVIEATDEARARLAGFGGPLVVAADTRPVLDTDASTSPFRHLWEPLDPADIKSRYYCDSMSFTASDLATAVDGTSIESMELTRTTGGRRSTETWDIARVGDCEPQAAIERGLGGRWRLDPRFPAPGPRTRKLHVIGNAGCNGTVRRGKAHIRMARDAAIVTIPMGDKVHSDMCHGLGPKRMTITLPKPLGDRRLYDAGSLPVRRIALKGVGVPIPRRGDVDSSG